MGRSMETGSSLWVARERLARWRSGRGGRGRRIPAELWEEAVKVAREEGAETTARALRLDRKQLERRLESAELGREAQDPGSLFVELRAGELGSRGGDVVQFVGSDGTRVRVELRGTVDVEALARTFWDRER